MTYEAGELKVVTPADVEQLAAVEEFSPEYYEIQERIGWGGTVIKDAGGHAAAFLPHRCAEWIIGGPVEVRALIADLQAALVVLEGGR